MTLFFKDQEQIKNNSFIPPNVSSFCDIISDNNDETFDRIKILFLSLLVFKEQSLTRSSGYSSLRSFIIYYLLFIIYIYYLN